MSMRKSNQHLNKQSNIFKRRNLGNIFTQTIGQSNKKRTLLGKECYKNCEGSCIDYHVLDELPLALKREIERTYGTQQIIRPKKNEIAQQKERQIIQKRNDNLPHRIFEKEDCDMIRLQLRVVFVNMCKSGELKQDFTLLLQMIWEWSKELLELDNDTDEFQSNYFLVSELEQEETRDETQNFKEQAKKLFWERFQCHLLEQS
eukprot:TRINITY_DN28877_c0_g1_i1.p2 TRINITY_DN28877_c0_g1~~TRINITY_DN28877_c0_g1_i1.p2  ORF type:complete len:213 (-),score=4.17 TRINITY_DN28877_c0_g1_i1:117-725(-)